MSKYVGVTFHKRTSRWLASSKGRGANQRSFATEEEAASYAADVRKTTVTNLRKPKPQWAGDCQLERFRILIKVYKGNVPGDLDAMITFARAFPLFRVQAPALFFLAICGKEGPWMHAVHKSFMAVCATSGLVKCDGLDVKAEQLFLCLADSSSKLATAANKLMHQVLTQAIETMVSQDRRTWSANTSRHVAHHSGWLALMGVGGYKMLEVVNEMMKRSPRGQRRQRVIELGATGKQYVITPFSPELHGPLFNAAHVVQQLINSCPPPRSLADWATITDPTTGLYKEMVARRAKLPKLSSDGYGFLWAIRAHLIVVMRANGIEQLEMDPKFTTSAFARMFPDQSHWIRAWGNSGKNVGWLFKKMEYAEAPELFSMYACLFSDDQVINVSPEFLRENLGRLQLLRQTCKTSYGQNPHPAVLLSELRAHVGSWQESVGSAGSAQQPADAIVALKRPASSEQSAGATRQ